MQKNKTPTKKILITSSARPKHSRSQQISIRLKKASKEATECLSKFKSVYSFSKINTEIDDRTLQRGKSRIVHPDIEQQVRFNISNTPLGPALQ